MKLLLPILLVLACAFAQDGTGSNTGTTSDIKCSDGSTPALQDGSTNAECYCGCTSRNPEPQCATLTDVQTAYRDSSGSGSQELKLQIAAACVSVNDVLASCALSQLSFPDAPADCGSICPVCDQSEQCATYRDSSSPQYRCYQGQCVQKTCETTTDSLGNVMASYSFSTVSFTDNREFCTDLCGSDPVAKNDTDVPCTSDEMGDDGCYYPCTMQSDGNKYLSTEPELAVNVLGSADSLSVYRDFCKTRNTELADCPAGAIVAREDGSGCGCGVCLESCRVDRQYVTYLDNGAKKCKKYECTTTDVIVTATVADSITGTDVERTYDNVRKTETITENVDLSYCTGETSDTTSTTASADDECLDPCGDSTRDRSICVEDADGNQVTFECPMAYKCEVETLTAAGSDVTYTFVGYHECKESTDTTDECTVGEMIVTDRTVSTSKCSLVCKCVANVGSNGEVYRNSWLCDTLERQFVNLKERCADKLGADTCTFSRLYYAECPSSLDDDICSKLYCDTTTDVNDPTVVGDAFVCRASAEGFATDVTVRDETNGCKYKECDDDSTSTTYGEIVERRYDQDTVTCTRIVDACPELAECRGVTAYETNGLCGVCPTCGADETNVDNTDRCSRDTIERGDAACIEDPTDDETRVAGEEIAGRCRIRIAQRVCAARFLGYTRDELYEKIKSAAMYVARQCATVDTFDYLRAAITAFDYEAVDADTDKNETCSPVLLVTFQIDFSDIDLERIRTLAECLSGLTNIGESVAEAITLATTGDRVDDTGSADEGAYASADSSSAAQIYVTTADGTVLVTEPTSTEEGTTTAGGDPTRDGNSASAYGLMLAVFAAVVAAMLQ